MFDALRPYFDQQHEELGDAGGREFDLWLHKIGAEIVPIDSEQAEAARRACRRYGKGRHAVALNYGDCFASALARTRSERCCSRAMISESTDLSSSAVADQNRSSGILLCFRRVPGRRARRRPDGAKLRRGARFAKARSFVSN